MKDLIEVFKNAKKYLMAGVSYLIPVVVVGGIMTGLGVAFGGTSVADHTGTFAYAMYLIGQTGLNLMAPVLCAYIAYSIADKSALGPGFIVGMVAQNCGAGFLGGLIGGFFCGIVAVYLKKIRMPRNFEALKSIILIPSVTALTGGLLMYFLIGNAVSAFITILTNFLAGLGTTNLVLIGLAFGFVGSFDLGLFGSKAAGAVVMSMMSQIDPETGLPMMIVLRMGLTLVTASTVPSLVAAIATFVKPKVFTPEQRESGKAALFLGLFGITEGAIPLALSDFKVYLGCVIGSMAGCVSSMISGAGTIVPWGGIPTIPGCTNPIMYIISLAVGIVVGAGFIVLTKRDVKQQEESTGEVKVKQTSADEIDLDF